MPKISFCTSKTWYFWPKFHKAQFFSYFQWDFKNKVQIRNWISQNLLWIRCNQIFQFPNSFWGRAKNLLHPIFLLCPVKFRRWCLHTLYSFVTSFYLQDLYLRNLCGNRRNIGFNVLLAEKMNFLRSRIWLNLIDIELFDLKFHIQTLSSKSHWK